MPGMQGIELLRRVKDRHPEVIRLITSAQYGPEGLRRYCTVGKDEEDLFHYVLKTDPHDLIVATQQAADEYERQADERRLPR